MMLLLYISEMSNKFSISKSISGSLGVRLVVITIFGIGAVMAALPFRESVLLSWETTLVHYQVAHSKLYN